MVRHLLRLFLIAVVPALIATPASAHRSGVGIGLSFGFPLFSFGPPVYYPPPPVYYPPPPVVYVPPPTAYAPPPGLSAVPTSPPYIGPSGTYCREFETFGMVGGRRERLYGTACQQPDGSWRVVR